MCAQLRENLILCIGSPLIDLIAEVDNNFLSEHHLQQNDATIANETHKDLFQKLKTNCQKLEVGGSVTNTARTIQRFLEFPKITSYIGAIGEDDFGNIIETTLMKENLNFLPLKCSSSATGKCAVLVTGENRSMVTDLGASGRFSKPFLMRTDVQDLIEAAEYYYMSAFFLGVSYDVMLEICRHSKSNNKKALIMNIGAPFLCKKHVEEFKNLMFYVDVLAGNEEEARSLAAINDIFDADIKTIAIKLYRLEYDKHLVIITRGPKSVIVAKDNEINEFEVPEIEKEQIVDTSGAGDAFMGGFIAEYVRGMSIEECVKCGIRAAQEIICKHGFNFK